MTYAMDPIGAVRVAALRQKYRNRSPKPNYTKPTLRGAANILWGSRDQEIIICGPSETGKTYAALSWLNSLMWDYPGAQGAIIRKTYASVHGSVLQTFRRILGRNTHVRSYGGEKPEWFDYPNGSRLFVGGMDNPDKVLSSERDVIYINQAEELGKLDYEMLTTRNTGRGSVMPFTQTFGDCNPSGTNHWILERQKAGHLRLLSSFHEDNPTLYDDEGNITEQGTKTLARLDALSGVLYKRLRLGQWGVPAGLIYDCFDMDKHTVPWFAIPDNWPRYGGLDFGGVNTAAIFIAEEPGHKEGEEQYFVYREYHAGGKAARQHADDLKDGEPTIPYFMGGSKSEDQWRTEFANGGLPVREPSVSDVEVGIGRGQSLFKKGRIKVFQTCTGFIDQLQSYSRKLDANGEPTEEIADKAKWHLMDAYRYIANYLAGDDGIGVY